jgi:hypothetical protein
LRKRTHRRGTRIVKEVEICAINEANKTKCMSTNAKKWKKIVKTSLIVGKNYYKYKKGLGNAHPAYL